MLTEMIPSRMGLNTGIDLIERFYSDVIELETELFASVERGDTNRSREILSLMPEVVYAANAAGDTLLHRATASGDSAVVALLLARGARIDAINTRGLTPLHLAIMSGRDNVTNLLVQLGADATLLKLSLA